MKMGRICNIPGCDREYYARGYCNPHYRSKKRSGELEVIYHRSSNPNHKNCEACGREFKVKPSNYDRIYCCSMECNKKRRKYAMPKMEEHYNWQGGNHYHKTLGRHFITINKRASKRRNIMYRYRWVMEQHLGRELSPDEVIHHIDGDKTNDDLSNLQLMTQSEHAKLHDFGRIKNDNN
jgi:hypothetical protein